MATTTAAVPCPRSAKPLTDPDGLGWCSACGFCKSLEENQVVATPAPAKPAEEVINPLAPPQAPWQAKDFVPAWALILLFGMALIGCTSHLISRRMPPEGFHRALWTSCQIGLGVLLLLIAQFVGVFSLGPKNPTLSFKDVLAPFSLWGLVVKNLPGQQTVLWLGGWGLSLILSACLLIGGLGHWFTYLPGGKNHPSNKNTRR